MISANVSARFAELPANLSAHVQLTVAALAVGVFVSVPLAVWLVKSKVLRYPVLTGAGVVQTIPSLALLALMVPILDKTGGLGLGLAAFGFWPAIIALTLYSVLPILRNTVTGILGVDSDLTEAARGVGMTARQILFKVELPLAAPVIIAGIRTATVWVVGIATLATPVGQRCLGNYIFAGLQTRNWTMVMFGVVSAALLAVILDALIGGLQKAVEERRRNLMLTNAIVLMVIGIGGIFSPAVADWMRTTGPAMVADADDSASRDLGPRPVVHIGSKTFTEQYILAALIGRTLREAGFETRRTDSLGSVVIFNALAESNIDVYVEYTGTVWVNTMHREEILPPWRIEATMSGYLAETFGVRNFGSLGFENTYAVAMRRDHAESLGITSMVDLANHVQNMKVGGDYEFFARPEWTAMRSAYGLDFEEVVAYDSSLMYEAIARDEVDVIAAFSTDGRIAAYDLVVLEDSRHVIPPYDAVVLLAPSIANRPDVAEALAPLLASIDVPLMQQANHLVDREEDRYSVEEAAAWLAEQIEQRREIQD